jgi:hypothetical protein
MKPSATNCASCGARSRGTRRAGGAAVVTIRQVSKLGPAAGIQEGGAGRASSIAAAAAARRRRAARACWRRPAPPAAPCICTGRREEGWIARSEGPPKQVRDILGLQP